MSEKPVNTLQRKMSSSRALLDSATKLFVEKGYEAVSTRELAEAAGVNLGAIQYHFGSKAGLFVQTVKSLMQDSGCDQARAVLELSLGSSREAAKALCGFIHGFMSYLLRPTGPQACRLMFREVLSAKRDDEMFEALISSVATEFTKPLEDTLVSVLRVINDNLSQVELEFCAQSIIGQCSLYLTHRPFLERMRASDYSASPLFDETVTHICRFSLAALGCSEELTSEAIEGMMSECVLAPKPITSLANSNADLLSTEC